MFRISVCLPKYCRRTFSEDVFKKKGTAEENVYIRKEDHRLLRDLRKQKAESRYQKYREQKEKMKKMWLENHEKVSDEKDVQKNDKE